MRALLLVAGVFLACSAGLAQAEDAAADPFAPARTHLQKGRYEEALEAYAALAEMKADPALVAVGQSRAHEAQGNWAEATAVLEAAVKAVPKAPALWVRLAEVQLAQGRYAAAETSVTEALKLNPDQPAGRLVRADLYTETGRLKEADEEYRWFVRYYNRAQPKDAETLLIIAHGAAQYARWHSVSQIFNFVVNTLCTDALAADAESWQSAYISGSLLLEKYNRAQALPEFQQALAINPRAADVIAAQAGSAAQEFEMEEAARLVEQALDINPRHVDALLIRADIELNDGKIEAALTALELARQVNPHHQQLLARLAACYLLSDGPPPADQLQEVLTHLDLIKEAKVAQPDRFLTVLIDLAKQNPHPGYFLTALGQQLEARRKFDLAERFYQAATQSMPQLAEPKTSLGMLYMRVGKGEEAAKLLEQAFKADPYHIRVSNMRKVSKLLDGYETITTDHFVIRVDGEADRILGKYMAAYLEEEYPKLVEQFGYEPATRTQFEIFNKAKGLSGHEWFSARMVGLPWIQTIGASTGMIVALASPTSGDQQFNWARVVKHEFVHILTLQETNFNIPHWFTEALAVQSEGYPRPETWNALLRERVPKGELMNLDNINYGFIRPKTPLDWQMAYCQSQLYAQYMVKTYGEDSIPQMLAAYRDNLSTEAALKQVFKVEKADFEAGYLKFVQELTATLSGPGQAEPELPLADLEKAHKADPEDLTAAGRWAAGLLEAGQASEARKVAEAIQEKDPKEPRAAVVMAKLELRAQDFGEAIRVLEAALNRDEPYAPLLDLLGKIHLQQENFQAAAELYELGAKQNPGNTTWIKGQAIAYLQLDDTENLRTVLIQLAELDADDAVVRKKLTEILLAEKDYQKALETGRRTLHIDVMDADVHRLIAEAHLGLKQPAEAAEEFAIAVQINAESPELQMAHAQALVAADKKAEARTVLEKLIGTTPNHPGAAELLEKVKK